VIANYLKNYATRYGKRLVLRGAVALLVFGVTFAVHLYSKSPSLPLAGFEGTTSTVVPNCTPDPNFNPDDKDITSASATVTRVIDGDTVDVNLNCKIETIRFIGMDTPETVDPRKPVQCFGKEASDNSKSILTGKTITLQFDPTQDRRDKYGRLLAYIILDGVNIDEQLVQQGFAREYTYKIPYEYQSQFRTDQKEARAEGLGLWASSTCDGKVPLPVS